MAILIQNERMSHLVDAVADGYKGDVVVTISANDPDIFLADNHLGRFPARIRAAATALRDCGMHGRFRIIHERGLVEIQKV